mgnify:CR=1 FL=1
MTDNENNVESVNFKNIDFNNKYLVTTTDMDNIFENCVYLTNISFECPNFIIKLTGNIATIFKGCENLESINFGNLDTSQIADMSNLFANFYKIEYIIFGNNFITNNVKNMENMFSLCSGLTSINISSFETFNVTKMNSMFDGCSNLVEIEMTIENFDTSNVETMEKMFCN